MLYVSPLVFVTIYLIAVQGMQLMRWGKIVSAKSATICGGVWMVYVHACVYVRFVLGGPKGFVALV